MTKKSLIILLALVGLGLLTRLVWHPANTTALAAIAVFAGFYFRANWSWLVPISVLAISDPFLGAYEWPVQLSVYLSFLAVWQMGRRLKARPSLWFGLAAVVVPSTLFFIVTNLAVWAFTPWYVKSFGGLAAALLAGVPFWRNMLIGDAVWLGIIFAAYYLLAVVEQGVFLSKLWYTKRVSR